MKEFLRLLIVEDSPADAALLVREFEKDGFKVESLRVETPDAMSIALQSRHWDIVISDYSMPKFSALDALKLAQDCPSELPFIIVSGAVGEEAAVEAMLLGADDFVVKNSLSRLVPAVRRELQKVVERAARLKAESAFAESQLSRKIANDEARYAAELSSAQFKFLAQASQVLSKSLETRDTFASLERLMVPDYADICLVKLRSPEGHLITEWHSRGAYLETPLETLKFRLDEICERQFPVTGRSGPFFLESSDTSGQPEDADRLWLASTGMQTLAAFPLVSGGVTRGVLCLFSTVACGIIDADRFILEEIAQRAAIALDNNRLYNVANAAIQSRQDFMSMASHELKTPLTALNLSLQLIKEGFTSDPAERCTPAMLSEFFDASARQLKRIIALIDDLTDMTRIQTGQMSYNPTRVEVGVLLQEVRDRALSTNTSASVIELLVTDDLVVFCDRMRIEQVIANLLSNAIKYGSGNPITVTLRRHEEFAEIAFRDQGIGIAPALLEKVFDRYERASKSDYIKGLGLGLYIVRQIISLHLGSVSVQSEVGKGSIFTVRLPFDRVRPKTALMASGSLSMAPVSAEGP